MRAPSSHRDCAGCSNRWKRPLFLKTIACLIRRFFVFARSCSSTIETMSELCISQGITSPLRRKETLSIIRFLITPSLGAGRPGAELFNITIRTSSSGRCFARPRWLSEILVDNERAIDYWTRIFDKAHIESDRAGYWDFQWLFACWAQRGLSILPGVNLISNIGFEARATHTTIAGRSKGQLPDR